MTVKPANARTVPFVPSEVQCTISKAASVDQQGRPVAGAIYEDPCSILKRPGDNTDISAKIGSSPDHPTAPLGHEDAVLLLGISTKAHVDDVIEVAGMRLQAVAISPSYDGVGLAYHVVHAITCD